MNKLYSTTLLFFVLMLTGISLNAQIAINHVSTYHTGVFDEGAAEIVAFDSASQQLFFINADSKTIDVLDISSVRFPTFVKSISLAAYGKSANSVAVKNGIIAAAVEDTNKQATGKIVFFDAATGNHISDVTAGALPDMVTFSPDGTKVLSANEGEPNDDYTVDPEGSVTVVDISGGVANVTQSNVTQITFSAFNGATLDPSIRIFGSNGTATVAEDLEPEYIAVDASSSTAYVTMQENNAMAIIDLSTNTITSLVGLGFKDHSLSGNGLDNTDKDGAINIGTQPVFGMYMPDAIASFTNGGNTYILSANEGDSRDYDGYSEEVRVEDLILDPTVFPNAASLQTDNSIGRLKTTTATGDIDNDGDHDVIYTYGARSFSIWNSAGALVYDSGDIIEQQIALADPTNFNSNNDDNSSMDKRSDDKGPEPEAIEYGVFDGTPYAFVGLERMGGIMAFDITDPTAPIFVTYINNRDFSKDADAPLAMDLGIEDILFMDNKGDGKTYLVTGNEVSGTVSIFEITSTVSIEENELKGKNWTIYPNPISGNTLNTSIVADYTVYDVYGRMISEHVATNQIDVSNLAKGTYVIKAENGTSQLFIKQ